MASRYTILTKHRAQKPHHRKQWCHCHGTNETCIRDMSNNGNSLVNSEMGNPWSTYVPLSIHLECWHTGRRGLEHSVELTHWGQTLVKQEFVLWDPWIPVWDPTDSETSTCCPFPTKHHHHYNMLLHCLTHNTSIWIAYAVFYQTEAVTLSFTYTRTGAGSSSMPSSLSTIQIFIKQSIQIQIWPQV